MPRPQKIADVLSELIIRRGYARQQSAQACADAWQQAAGDCLAPYTRVGNIRRGALEVIVAHSALAQEISFQKTAILQRLARLLPEVPITDLRLRVGPLD